MGPRPTDEQRAECLKGWEEWLNSTDPMAHMASTNPDFAARMQEIHVAGEFLTLKLKEMQFPSDQFRDLGHKLGRLSFGREVWVAFDLVYNHAVETMTQFTQRKVWVETPVPQDVPEPTELLKGWFAMAKNSVGDKGVFPQVLHWKSDDGVVVEALAIGGGEAMNHTTDRFQTGDVTELVLGVDMSAVPGQGLLYEDFLAVVWYVGGEFYTGVINYQKTGDVPEGQEPAFHDIEWTNNYWNHSLREHPVTAMREAVATRCP